MIEERSIGPKKRESWLCGRLSPITKYWPSGTVHSLLRSASRGSVGAVSPSTTTTYGSVQPDRRSTRRRHEDAAVIQGDRVARQADDPLDERHAALLEALRRLEDDDVAAVVVAEARRELVDQDVLVLHDRGEHRVLLDFERLRR